MKRLLPFLLFFTALYTVNITAQNVMPTLEGAYEYVIAIGTAFKPALGSRLRSEVRRIQRIVKQFVDREARKQT